MEGGGPTCHKKTKPAGSRMVGFVTAAHRDRPCAISLPQHSLQGRLRDDVDGEPTPALPPSPSLPGHHTSRHTIPFSPTAAHAIPYHTIHTHPHTTSHLCPPRLPAMLVHPTAGPFGFGPTPSGPAALQTRRVVFLRTPALQGPRTAKHSRPNLWPCLPWATQDSVTHPGFSCQVRGTKGYASIPLAPPQIRASALCWTA